MSFHIPERKVPKLFHLPSSPYRELARIAGSIISVALAVGPISRLLTRQMYLAIESRSAISTRSFNGYSLRPTPDSSTVIFLDASDVAFGGFSASLDGVTASGMFTSEDLG